MERLAPWAARGVAGTDRERISELTESRRAFGCSIDHHRLYRLARRRATQVVAWRRRVARVAIHCVSSSRGAGSAAQKRSMMVVKPIKPSSRSLCVSMTRWPWSGFGENERHC